MSRVGRCKVPFEKEQDMFTQSIFFTRFMSYAISKGSRETVRIRGFLRLFQHAVVNTFMRGTNFIARIINSLRGQLLSV